MRHFGVFPDLGRFFAAPHHLLHRTYCTAQAISRRFLWFPAIYVKNSGIAQTTENPCVIALHNLLHRTHCTAQSGGELVESAKCERIHELTQMTQNGFTMIF